MLLRRYHKVEEEKVPFDDIHKLENPLTQEVEINLEGLIVKELKEIALEKGIEVPKKIKKDDLIKLIREG